MSSLYKLIILAYGGLSILAAGYGIREDKKIISSYSLMGLGGFLLVYTAFYLENKYLIILPLALLQIAAYMNGRKQGEVKISHHIIRLMISISIFVLNFIV